MQQQTRTPQQPPVIAPLESGVHRPLFSVMIPAYNCIHYLGHTIQSVLTQALPEAEMQIEVIDDASTDGDVAALVANIGKGRVGYYRQPENGGSLRNFETCINRAKGHYVHILHGDDFVVDGFYQEIQTLFDAHPTIGAAFTDFIYVDEENKELWVEKPLTTETGVLDNWLEKIAVGQRVQPPAMVVKRSVYEQLGSFFGVHYGEDWEMWVRIAAYYDVAHSPKYLARYRIHTTNITSRSFLSGQNIRDINQVIKTIAHYLPADIRDYLSDQARRNFSIYFAKISHKVYHHYKDPKAALVQAKGAWNMHHNWETFHWVLKLYIKYLIRYKTH